MKKGCLYWITGLAGAGKTTIGNRLYYKMKSKAPNTIILDGDILKKIAGKDLGYSKEERLERAYRYCALCKLLTDQGINVIICTIAMYDEIRNWNRDNIENYVEVFLDVDMEVLKTRNRKGLYSKTTDKIAGVNVEVEFPKTPDIIIQNNEYKILEKSVQKIIDYHVKPKVRWNKDEKYWDKYYASEAAKSDLMCKPSLFACDMLQKYMISGKNLIELGCGNGRDSIYFAENGLNVIGIDASQVVINELQQKASSSNCTFVCDDFVSTEALYQIQYDYCYSRFTFHAINEWQETQILLKVYDLLKENGYLFIEARSTSDEKYGMGEKVEKNAFIYEGHYRRFIEPIELISKLTKIGFNVINEEESNQFAPKEGENSVCIRVVAQKQ